MRTKWQKIGLTFPYFLERMSNDIEVDDFVVRKGTRGPIGQIKNINETDAQVIFEGDRRIVYLPLDSIELCPVQNLIHRNVFEQNDN
jgi:hypothetical protein